MTLFQVDDAGLLYISPIIQDWSILADHAIDVVIDLEGGLDSGVPTAPDKFLYVYFPMYDEDLPDLAKLLSVASLGANLVRSGRRVLCHCTAGFNRSALMAGLILKQLGTKGTDAVTRLRERRPGALQRALRGLPGVCRVRKASAVRRSPRGEGRP